MLTPANNRDGYERTSVLKAAKNLSGKLLLIHGGIDDNVHMQNTTQLVYELQKADKQFDVMYYPTARHGITNQAQVKHWYTMMTEFILEIFRILCAFFGSRDTAARTPLVAR